MQQLFTITASSAQAYQHYIDTIENGFSLESIKKFLSDTDYSTLIDLYGAEKVRAWGALPGSSNIRNWKRLKKGDRLLIYRNSNYEYFATITHKIHSPHLAHMLWGTNESGEKWEYLYFLKDVTDISVPTIAFNDILDFKKSFNPQGFGPIAKERCIKLINTFGSIDGFLDYLLEGKWVKNSSDYPDNIQKKIVNERTSRQIEKTNLYEKNVEDFLADRVNRLEEGLRLIKRQLDTKEVGILDLLCKDKDDNFVIIELKRNKAGPSIIDQIQRYMGWIKRHHAKQNQIVRGIIVVRTKDSALEYSVEANPLLQVKQFTIGFT